MNSETVTLIERPFQEIVDDILTAIVGGVVNEPIIFDVKSDLYPLAEPAQELRSVTGTFEKEHHAFQMEIDFLFSAGDNAVVWQEGGKWPDDDTVFYVDYFRQDSRSPLTDTNVGSVTRTLGEAVGREIATVYQQINQAYLSAFVDTAEGKSLDLVVAILGLTRYTKDYAVGQVTFFRDAASQGNITIPEGTSLTTTKGEAAFQTTQLRTLQRGQVRISVPIRASDDFKGEEGQVDAGAITQLSQSITGIDRVTNHEATYLGAEDESDQELRVRAKAALRALGKGTLAALDRVIREGRATPIEVWDPNSPPDKRSDLGTVTLLVECEPESFADLQSAVQGTRAAGVQATLVARYVYFKPRIVAQIASGLTPAGKVKVLEEIIAALQTYVDGLESAKPAEGQELLKAVTEVEDVSEKDTRIVDVMTWRADVGQPGAESLVEAILAAIQSTSTGDATALRTAISEVVSETTPSLVPTEQRIPDRSLVQGLEGGRATDEQIEKGEFQVVAMVDDEKWWVALDIEQADILLKEKER